MGGLDCFVILVVVVVVGSALLVGTGCFFLLVLQVVVFGCFFGGLDRCWLRCLTCFDGLDEEVVVETEAPKERFFNGLGTSKGMDDATIIGIGLSGIVVLVVVVVVGGENEVVEKEVDETEEEEAEDDDVLGLRACCLEQPQDGQNLFKGGFRCPERQTQCIFVTICLCSVFFICVRR